MRNKLFGIFYFGFIAFCAFCFISGGVRGDPWGDVEGAYSSSAQEQPKDEEKADTPKSITKGYDTALEAQCPRTLIKQNTGNIYGIDNCLKCHVIPTWGIKETLPDVQRQYPNSSMRIEGDTLIFNILGTVDITVSNELEAAIQYARWHPEVKRFQIDILSGGGSLFIGWQVVTRLEALKSEYHITTYVPGFAGSAAFLVWMAGDERECFAHTMLMWHELWTFSFFSIEDVSDTEENARVKRLLQDNAHAYILKHCTLTKQQLDEYVKGVRDYWLMGEEAFEVGFATKLIGK